MLYKSTEQYHGLNTILQGSISALLAQMQSIELGALTSQSCFTAGYQMVMRFNWICVHEHYFYETQNMFKMENVCP